MALENKTPLAMVSEHTANAFSTDLTFPHRVFFPSVFSIQLLRNPQEKQAFYSTVPLLLVHGNRTIKIDVARGQKHFGYPNRVLLPKEWLHFSAAIGNSPKKSSQIYHVSFKPKLTECTEIFPFIKAENKVLLFLSVKSVNGFAGIQWICEPPNDF